MNKHRGLLVVISSPSGGGKTTVINHILKKGNPDVVYSVSVTTRLPRQNEIDGRDYYFVNENLFRSKIKGNEFIEWEKVHNRYYGTLAAPLLEWLEKGKIVLMDLDVKGALTIRKRFPNDSLSIFLSPPKTEVLIDRLTFRSSEDEDEINIRLQAAEKEMEAAKQFDEKIINDDLDRTVNNVWNLIINKMSRDKDNPE